MRSKQTIIDSFTLTALNHFHGFDICKINQLVNQGKIFWILVVPIYLPCPKVLSDSLTFGRNCCDSVVYCYLRKCTIAQ